TPWVPALGLTPEAGMTMRRWSARFDQIGICSRFYRTGFSLALRGSNTTPPPISSGRPLPANDPPHRRQQGVRREWLIEDCRVPLQLRGKVVATRDHDDRRASIM